MSITAMTTGGNPQILQGQILYDRVLAPTFAASQNNLNIAGFNLSSGIYLRSTVAIDITGLVGGTPDRRVTLINIGANDITLKNEDNASLAQNRFSFGADVILTQNTMIDLEWNPSAVRWLPVAAPGGGSPSPGVFTNISISGSIIETGELTPPQIVGDENDYSPVGFSAASTLRLDADAPHNITGFLTDTGTNNSRVMRLINVGAQDITLLNLNVGSAAGNQIIGPAGQDFVLVADGNCTIYYDTTSTKWRVLA